MLYKIKIIIKSIVIAVALFTIGILVFENYDTNWRLFPEDKKEISRLKKEEYRDPSIPSGNEIYLIMNSGSVFSDARYKDKKEYDED